MPIGTVYRTHIITSTISIKALMWYSINWVSKRFKSLCTTVLAYREFISFTEKSEWSRYVRITIGLVLNGNMK